MDPVFGFTTFVRFSWSTIKNILDDKAVDCEWEEEEDEEEAKVEKKTVKISNYFIAQTAKPNKKPKINWFLKERNLQNVNDFDDFVNK